MITLDPEQAYIAVNAFLKSLWRIKKQPGELGLFCGFISYIPGVGSSDPAMWYDWLAMVKNQQTGLLVPENTGERGTLSADMLGPLDPAQAYQAMFAFIEEYWERVSRPAELGDLLGRMRYMPGTGSADPGLWQSWNETFKKVQARPQP